MRPPIFPIQTGGSQAQEYLHRAMQFRDAAMPLASYVNGQPNWPRIALLTHAIELALKAFVFHAVESGLHPEPAKPPYNHDLEGWYRLAVAYGLSSNPDLAESISVLNKLHRPHFARYPQPATFAVRGTDTVPDEVVEHLISDLMPVIFPR
ncbi:hypothetical protein IVB18_47825 [Bradyrhizobium sp. 186]|uniref:hypothetical protein n=1 Tax=Bradyrhizobium sp. 186 TaxID=2782654 RepID=UPI002000E700|nr:hypothetical protein [Bradyrhizobium sp. 186]UPK35565.1 hypothetical protein IVB18_47825 [Bradyrhizobium sp. 186]